MPLKWDRIRSLVLFVRYTDQLSYYDDWLDALSSAPRLDVTALNIGTAEARDAARRLIPTVDAIILHHSVSADSVAEVAALKPALLARRGILFCFVGNEVNLPLCPIREKIAFLRDTEADIVATQLPLEAGQWLYADCASAKIVGIPHALNPDVFRPTAPQVGRPIDVGSRSAKYGVYMGDDDRVRIHDYFAKLQVAEPFVRDLAIGKEQERFNRAGWASFLNRCKATIGTEAGSFYLERDDRTVDAIQDYLRGRSRGRIVLAQGSRLRTTVRALLPEGLRRRVATLLGDRLVEDYNLSEDADASEIQELFFSPPGRAPVYTKAISSRHFDAAGTKTCQIMFPGRYNDILEKDKHYIALATDFSNSQDVLERFFDDKYRQTIVDETYEYIISRHTYKHRIDTLTNLIEMR